MNIARVSRTKADARATYNRRSRGYERIEGRFERNARVTGEHIVAVAPNERVLEVGSGPGVSLVAFAHAVGPHGAVIGVDIAPDMHAVAAARLHTAGLGARASLLVGDAVRLPLADASFDVAFASFTLELFDTPELPAVLRELARVLCPAGRLGVVSLVGTDPPATMERAYLLAHKLLPRLADCRPIPLHELVVGAGYTVDAVRRCDILGIPVVALAAHVDNFAGTAGRE